MIISAFFAAWNVRASKKADTMKNGISFKIPGFGNRPSLYIMSKARTKGNVHAPPEKQDPANIKKNIDR